MFLLRRSLAKPPNSTFEEGGKFEVNSKNEANWLSIQRKRQISCQFKERVNQPAMIIHQASLSKNF